jgi:phosphatidylglycerol:prolipoprotein diacylglycerol transferase
MPVSWPAWDSLIRPLAFPALLNAAALCYALAYAVGTAAFALMARRRGLATSGVGAVSIAGLLGGLVGANLAQWLTTGSGGKSVLGGVAGGYLAVVLYKRYLGVRRPTGDLFAVALSAGEAVGRFGCFVGGCCYGVPTAVSWAVYQHGAWRHPTQLYLALLSLLILTVLLWIEFRAPLPENGLLYVQGTLYAVGRFLVEFFREGTPFALGLTAAQWACLAGFVFFGSRLALFLRLGPASIRVGTA